MSQFGVFRQIIIDLSQKRMIKTKFLRLLATLDKDELKDFERFIYSPYYNSRKQPLQLFDYLKSNLSKWHHPFLNYISPDTSKAKKQQLELHLESILSKATISEHLYPGERFNDPRMRRIVHYLKQLLEEFLYALAPKAEQEYYLRHIAMLRHHLHRGEFDLFEAQLTEVRKRQQQTTFRDHQFYYYAYQVEEVANDYLVRTARNRDSFQQMTDFFDAYFILNKLRLFCGMATREKMFEVDYRYQMMEELIHYIEKTDFNDVPLIGIYYHILHLEQARDDRMHFKQLELMLKANKAGISSGEQRNIYGFMLNYLTRENRKPGQKMYAELYQLLRTMVEEGLIYINNKITIPYFNLGVRAACRMGEFDWVEDFIYAHEDRLIGQNATEVIDLSLLTVLHYRGEYDTVLQRIDRLRFKDPRLQVLRRMLKLQTLYESNAPNAFFQLTDAFKRFIKSRKEIGRAAFTYFSNFVSFTERLGRIKFDLKPIKKDLAKEIQDSPTAEKDWLLDKLQEIAVRTS